MRALSLLGAVLWVARVATAGTVWIDTDVSIGSPIREVDDAYALVLAFHSPEIRIAGISISYGNAPLGHTTKMARELVERFGAPAQITTAQVVRGAKSPGDLGRATEASEALAKTLKKGPLTYIALGPLTNLATFLQLHPKMAGRIDRVIFLGGQAEGTTLAIGPRESFRIHDANVFKDPRAVAVVLAAGVPLTMVPVATASKLLLNGEDLRELERRGGAGNYLARGSKVWLWFWKSFVGTNGGAIFDAIAVLEATNPELLLNNVRYAAMDGSGDLRVTRRPRTGARRIRFCTGFRPEMKRRVMVKIMSRRSRE
jgi:inosine-uridine nucleoside N-ribohydrolase